MDLINTLLLKLGLGKKVHPLIVLGKKLSNNNNAVVKSLELYCFSSDAYFDGISEFEKDNCFIESLDDITPVDALVRALSSAGVVICVDNRSEPLRVLPLLQKLTPIRFETSGLFKDLETFYRETNYGFGSLVGGGCVEHSPTLFDCLQSLKLKMLAINDDSDALILFICHENEHTEIIELTKEAEINLYFEHM